MKLMLSESGASLRKCGTCLAVHRKDGTHVEVPVEDVTEILIAGRGISLSSDAVALAARAGLLISFLGSSGEPYAQAAPPFPGQHALLRQRQFEAATCATGLTLAKRFLRAKLSNQANLLKYFGKSRRSTHRDQAAELYVLARQVQARAGAIEALRGEAVPELRDTLMGHEGAAGHAYWKGITTLIPAEIGFAGRIHQDPPDAFNRALNYGYGILRARLWSAVVLGGLDPAAGFLHTWQPGRDSLVFDLIEGFRSMAVDRPLVAAVLRQWRPGACDETGFLDEATRRQVAALVLEQLDKPVQCGRSHRSVRAWMEEEVRACSSIILGECPGPPPVQAW